MDLLQKLKDSEPDFLGELQNLHEIARFAKPSPEDLPLLDGVDIYGETLPLNGVIGGDHIIYVDFKRSYDLGARIAVAQSQGRDDLVRNLRDCLEKAAIVVADVSGHRTTDAMLALMLHQAFLVGATFELDAHGQVTSRLIEILNKRFYQSSSVNKYLTLLFGEISSKGRFRFISAGHQLPVVFSRRFDRIVSISEHRFTTFPPIGTIPPSEDIDRLTTQVTPLGFKESYRVNEISLMGSGDILVLFTDGLTEHGSEGNPYFPGRLEETLREGKDRSAKELFGTIRDDLRRFAPAEDDITIVIIKRD